METRPGVPDEMRRSDREKLKEEMFSSVLDVAAFPRFGLAPEGRA